MRADIKGDVYELGPWITGRLWLNDCDKWKCWLFPLPHKQQWFLRQMANQCQATGIAIAPIPITTNKNACWAMFCLSGLLLYIILEPICAASVLWALKPCRITVQMQWHLFTRLQSVSTYMGLLSIRLTTPSTLNSLSIVSKDKFLTRTFDSLKFNHVR